MRSDEEVRLFFALWPDDKIRYQVAENLRCFNIDTDKSRLVSNSNLHLTLHFVGNASITEMKCLDRQARQVKAEKFDLSFDYSGYFKKPKVLWLGCRTVPQALIDLQQNLGREIAECQYTPEKRPYSPHLTVARKIYRAPEPVEITAIHWQVDRFVMVESIADLAGVRYEVAESYSFH